MTQDWITDKAATTADHAKPGTCPRCHAQVIRARAGRVAALDVIADPEPLDVHGELLARLEGRLTWHLTTSALGVQRLTWRTQFHIRAGPPKHPVLRDHRCPPQPVQETLL